MTGCASPTPRSLGTLPAIEKTTLKKVTEHLAEESAKLSETQDANQKGIEKRFQAPEPEPVAPKHDPLEDIVVTVNLRNTSLSAVLQVLAEQSKMNMLVDPEVLALDRHASLYLNRVSARELFRNVLEAFDLSGQVEGNTIKIGLYEQRLFNLDFLNMRMDMNITSGGNVFGSMSGGGSSGGSSGGGSAGGDLIRGNVNVTGGSTKQIEPYSEIEANLKRILGTKEGKVDKKEILAGQVAGAAEAAAQQQSGEHDRREMGAVYSLNRSSGTLYVNARPSQMHMVEKLIGRFAKVMRRQVLIEAQLLDVELNDQFQFGVDWDLMRNHLAGMVGNAPINAGSTSANLPGLDGLPLRTLTLPSRSVGLADGRSSGLMYSDNAISAALNVLRNFGNVKVLSNPNIRVRNNTPALLSVGTSNRFVAKSTVTTSNPGGGASTISADVQTDAIFAGVVVGVVPFIGERGDIDLLIHPMQTEVDPVSLRLQDVGAGNKVTLPQISYKGMTTTLNIKDGDTVIIGGLIDQKTASNDRGVPGLSDTPILGRLFGAESTSHKSRELVMVLRVKEL
ncbi:MAG: pilus (MSHA type) biogenesis protein MshL [Sulfuricella denitrificans]|nr:pilus (MSHA type) biogenesis protein MshL [Sulfuricella denitrificans]